MGAKNAGDWFYNEDRKVVQYCDGTDWVKIGADTASRNGIPASVSTRSAITGDPANIDYPHNVRVKGNYAYVASDVPELIIAIDITDLDAPSIEAVTAGSIRDIQTFDIRGDYIFAGEHFGPGNHPSLVVIDISDPTNITEVTANTYTSVVARPYDIIIDGDYVYMGTDTAIVVWDISTPTAPTSVTHHSYGADKMLLRDDGTLFRTEDGGAGMFCAHDASNITASLPLLDCILDADTTITNPTGIALSSDGNYAFYADADENKFVVIDVTNLNALSFVTELTNVSGELSSPYEVEVINDYAFVSVDDGITIINVSNPSAPSVVSSHLDATNILSGADFTIVDDKIYMTGQSDSFTILDISYVTDIVPDGLVAHYKFDETNGLVATDSSANGNDGILLAPTSGAQMSFDADSVTGIIGGALDFGAVNTCCGSDLIEMSSGSGFPTGAGAEFSVAFWYYGLKADTSGQGILMTYGDTDPSDATQTHFTIYQGPSLMRIQTNNGRIDYIPYIQTENKWTHISLTQSASEIRFYINGQEASSPAYADGGYPLTHVISPESPYLLIGDENADWAGEASIYLDDFRLYDRVLSASDIAQLHSAREASMRYNLDSRVPEYFNSERWVPAGVPKYTPNAVEFDGIDELSYLSDLTGVVDSKKFAASFWFRTTEASSTQQFLNNDDADDFRFELFPGTPLRFAATNSAGTQILRLDTQDTTLNDGDWKHALVSVDLGSASSWHVYINDVQENTTVFTYVDDVIDFTRGYFGTGPGGYIIDSDVADRTTGPAQAITGFPGS